MDHPIEAVEANVVVRGVLASLALVAPPGPVNLAQVDTGLSRGWVPSLAVGLGATLAIAVYAAAALAGAGAVARLPTLRTALWAAGTLLLAWYGWAALRSAALPVASAPAPGGVGRPFAFGYALGLFNPMAFVLLVALTSSAGGRAAGFLAGFVAGMVVWNLGLALASGSGSRFLRPAAMSRLRVVAGTALLAYAAFFAWSGFTRLFGG